MWAGLGYRGQFDYYREERAGVQPSLEYGGSRMLGVLKYGALGIGLAILIYTAELLRQELKRREPRREARNLIITFMLFSLAAFSIATYLELKEKWTTSDIATIAGSMDTNLGGKFAAFVKDDHSRNHDTLLYFTDQLCSNVQALKSAIGDKRPTTCDLHAGQRGALGRGRTDGFNEPTETLPTDSN